MKGRHGWYWRHLRGFLLWNNKVTTFCSIALHMYTYACMQTHTHAHTRTRTHTHAHTHTTRTRTHTHTHTHTVNTYIRYYSNTGILSLLKHKGIPVDVFKVFPHVPKDWRHYSKPNTALLFSPVKYSYYTIIALIIFVVTIIVCLVIVYHL